MFWMLCLLVVKWSLQEWGKFIGEVQSRTLTLTSNQRWIGWCFGSEMHCTMHLVIWWFFKIGSTEKWWYKKAKIVTENYNLSFISFTDPLKLDRSHLTLVETLLTYSIKKSALCLKSQLCQLLTTNSNQWNDRIGAERRGQEGGGWQHRCKTQLTLRALASVSASCSSSPSG